MTLFLYIFHENDIIKHHIFFSDFVLFIAGITDDYAIKEYKRIHIIYI